MGIKKYTKLSLLFKNNNNISGLKLYKKNINYKNMSKHSNYDVSNEYIDIIDINDDNNQWHQEKEKEKYIDRKVKSETVCEIQNQIKFCVPLVFQQELIAGTGGTGDFVPLSRSAQNLDRIYGTLQLKFNSKFSRLAYRLYVYNGTNPLNRITAAHLHNGAANEDGPVIFNLYNCSPLRVNGQLSHGVLNNDDVLADFVPDSYNFNSIASIYEGIRRGLVYVNVHSEQFPDGVVRGQIYLRDICPN